MECFVSNMVIFVDAMADSLKKYFIVAFVIALFIPLCLPLILQGVATIQHIIQHSKPIHANKSIRVASNDFVWKKNKKEILFQKKLYEVESFQKLNDEFIFSLKYDWLDSIIHEWQVVHNKKSNKWHDWNLLKLLTLLYNSNSIVITYLSYFIVNAFFAFNTFIIHGFYSSIIHPPCFY